MKKILSLVLGALLILSVFTACDEEHVHTFATDWQSDDTNHWHVASCEHTDLKSDLGAHTDNDKNDICDVCSKVMSHIHTYDTTTWKSDAEGHYYGATCGHDLKKDAALHVDTADNNGVCDVCGYSSCNHDYATEWSHDATNHWYAATCGHDVKKDTALHADDDNDSVCDVCGYDYDHTHIFVEDWTSDELYHWHLASCDHDVTSVKEQHKNEDGDIYCDICHYEVSDIQTFVATLAGNNIIPLTEQTVRSNAGTEVIFTFAADLYVVIDDVLNAEPVGEPVEANGIKTYTVKIAALNADTTVTVLAHRTTNANVIIPDGTLELIAEKLGNVTGSIEIEIPDPGRYVIYSDNPDIDFHIEGNILVQSVDPISCMFEVTEAGKMTVDYKFFAWKAGTTTAKYVVTKVFSANRLTSLEGDGCILPTNADVELFFSVPGPGLWQMTSTMAVSFDGSVEQPYLFTVADGELDRKVTIHYQLATEATFDFDWKITRVGGEPTPVTEGENAVYAPLDGYMAVTFIPDQTGTYRFVMSVASIYLNSWYSDESFQYMAGLGSDYISEEILEAGTTYTYYVGVFKYGMEEVTTDLEGTLTISRVYMPVMSTDENENEIASAMVGVGNIYDNTSKGESQYEITVSGGRISLDGGATWSSSVTTYMEGYQLFYYMVKADDGAATEVQVTFRRMAYESAFVLGENTLAMVPGQAYQVTLSGSTAGFYGEYILSWTDANITVEYKGSIMTSPAAISLYTDYSAITITYNGTSEASVNFTLADGATT